MKRDVSNPVAWARKVVAFVIGGTLLLIGLALLFLPGPGTVVGGVGLAILATEFVWARWLFKQIRAGASQVMRTIRDGTATEETTQPQSDDNAGSETDD